MEITFVGAAQTVTGSMHLLKTRHGTILLDCGLYQGRRRESYERNKNLRLPVGDLIAVVLSHAHIDHSGAIPLLVRNGYRGPIYCTPATRDLAAVMLRDAAAIQESDARFLNRQAEKQGLDEEEVVPLYNDTDALKAIGMFHSIPYGFSSYLSPDISLTFLDAGHVLGSAISLLKIKEGGEQMGIGFTGDLGRVHMPILEDPDIVPDVDLLIMESTYGDRLHDDIAKMDEDLASIITGTYQRGGKVIIPSFALERAQEVLFSIKKLRSAGNIPDIPVYVDSPLTIQITDVFKLHPECYDEETRALISSRKSPFDFEGLRYSETVEESKAIIADQSPSIIISASGMCEAGRVLHHLRSTIEDDRNTIVIVGYQAQHTLGRRLVERRSRVKIFGVERDLRAEVKVLNGFSAHADQSDLVAYAEQCREHGPVRQIALVHGDPKPQKVLADLLEDRGFQRPMIPAPDDTLSL